MLLSCPEKISSFFLFLFFLSPSLCLKKRKEKKLIVGLHQVYRDKYLYKEELWKRIQYHLLMLGITLQDPHLFLMMTLIVQVVSLFFLSFKTMKILPLSLSLSLFPFSCPFLFLLSLGTENHNNEKILNISPNLL